MAIGFKLSQKLPIDYRVFSVTWQQPGKYIATKGSVYIRKELNSHMIGQGHQHSHCLIVLQHQYS